MKTFQVTFKQIITVYEDIEANDEEDAKNKAEEMYNNDDIDFVNSLNIDHEIEIDKYDENEVE